MPIALPKISSNVQSVFHLFVIQVEKRQSLLNFLELNGIMAGIHYPLAIHQHPAYEGQISTVSDMSITEGIVQKIISLPMYPELTISDADKIVKVLMKFYQ